MYAEDEVLYTYKVLRDVTFAVFVGNLSSMKSQRIWSRVDNTEMILENKTTLDFDHPQKLHP